MTQSSIPAVLRERASLQPNDMAVTFVDYEQNWDGATETLTWSQLYRRTLNVAQELRRMFRNGVGAEAARQHGAPAGAA